MQALKPLLDHPAVVAIRRETHQTRYEGQLYLVGGSVRDALMGRAPKSDFDLVTELDSLELAQSLWQKGICEIPPVTYPRFGTAMVRILGVDIEMVQARRESYEEESRKPSVEPATLRDDAFRRDFTLNALMLNVHSGELVDLTERGLADLESKLLRTPLEPKATFFDDPLRMLRAIRFRWQLGVEPVEGLWEAIRDQASRLEVISAERIRDELIKMLRLDQAPAALDDLRETGLLAIFAPDLMAMKDVEQGFYHHLDVWDHTRKVVEGTRGDDLELRLAALLHDVGKPKTRTIDDKGQTRFFTHEVVGAEMAKHWLNAMRFPTETIDTVSLLVRHHMRLSKSDKMSAPAARRLIRDLGPNLERLLALVEADANGLKKGVRQLDLTAVRERVQQVSTEAKGRPFESPLDGRQIQAILGIPEGRAVGEAKAWLIERVLEGELALDDAETAQIWLKERYQSGASATEGDRTQ